MEVKSIIPMIQAGTGSSSETLYHNNKALDDLSKSFLALRIKNEDKVVMTAKAQDKSSLGAVQKWRRFQRQVSDNWYINETNWDAICIIPQQNIMFRGFGFDCSYHGHDQVLIFSYTLDGVDHDENY